MELKKENTTRKIDALGRIIIPKSIRDRFELNTNDEVEFYTLETDNTVYVCFTNHKIVKNEYAAAAKTLEALGVEIPEELAKRL